MPNVYLFFFIFYFLYLYIYIYRSPEQIKALRNENKKESTEDLYRRALEEAVIGMCA